MNERPFPSISLNGYASKVFKSMGPLALNNEVSLKVDLVLRQAFVYTGMNVDIGTVNPRSSEFMTLFKDGEIIAFLETVLRGT